jgi:glycosyltransferase involved in cell wall biosynthesis
LADAPGEPLEPGSWNGGTPSLYWFSQTIGPDRGLEQVVDAMAAMQTKVHLVLRGNPSSGYVAKLRQRAMSTGGDDFAGRIELLPVAPPDKMVGLCTAYDVGLAVEVPVTRNRDLCLTNKAFTYLLAGIPIVLSRTSAQSQLAPGLGPAALLVDISSPAKLATALDAFFDDRELQQRARHEAWRLGRERFNWDKEQQTLLAIVAALFRDSGLSS